MLVKQNCSAHIINITAQQIAARLAAHATIQTSYASSYMLTGDGVATVMTNVFQKNRF